MISKITYAAAFAAASVGCCLSPSLASAETVPLETAGGRLLLTGGVTQVEGSAGGGLTPWAVIGGYGSRDEVTANAFATNVETQDYQLTSYGVMTGIRNRVEFSIARQDFDLQKVGASLGLGRHYKINQTIVGAKVRVLGDAVLEQDTWLPQVALGLQYKHNEDGALVKSLGARHKDGVDLYASATKLFLDKSLLLNGTVRATKANQLGILGFGGKDDKYHAEFEGSAALLLNRRLAIGAEYRTKPDNLGVAKEGDAYDAFIAFAPTRNISVTLAYAQLGNIVTRRQDGVYASLQVGF